MKRHGWLVALVALLGVGVLMGAAPVMAAGPRPVASPAPALTAHSGHGGGLLLAQNPRVPCPSGYIRRAGRCIVPCHNFLKWDPIRRRCYNPCRYGGKWTVNRCVNVCGERERYDPWKLRCVRRWRRGYR